jgi:hypothetical protein
MWQRSIPEGMKKSMVNVMAPGMIECNLEVENSFFSFNNYPK